jgi:glycosyltransferase involved in cell wall biosynthesis
MAPVTRSSSSDIRDQCAVTVIVAAYNTGEPLHELVASLDAQTLPQERFEVIVVDDGSTDGTGPVLDDLAAARPNWVVRHIPNSGWPGTPRNVALDLARGEYVTFVDHDDFLGPAALESAYGFAARHHSDVVAAREVGVGRTIGRFMFAETIVDATFENSPIVRLLTPHKLYRRALVVAHGIRFPEGKVRLEDHLFTMQAYFAAKRISIYADTPFYFWTRREGTAHASIDLKDPHEYVDIAVNQVLDVVERHTEPGERRDRIKSHWLERKLLPIVARTSMLEYTPEYRVEMYGAVRRLVLHRYPEAADRYLGFSARLRAHLLRADRLDGLLRLAPIETDITTTVRAQRLTWTTHHLELDLAITLAYRDGSPVEFRRHGDRVLWEPRAPLSGPGDEELAAGVLDVSEEVLQASPLLLLQHRDHEDDVAVPIEGSSSLVPTGAQDGAAVVFTGVVRVPLAQLLALQEAPGRFIVDLRTEFGVLGWRSVRRVAAPTAGIPTPEPVQHPGLFRAYATAKDNLSLRVRRPARLPPDFLEGTGRVVAVARRAFSGVLRTVRGSRG